MCETYFRKQQGNLVHDGLNKPMVNQSFSKTVEQWVGHCFTVLLNDWLTSVSLD